MVLKFKKHLLEPFQGIDFNDMERPPKITELPDEFQVEVDSSDIQDMKVCMNYDIVGRGMDNQNTVNDLGKLLYEIYDEMLYQLGRR